MGGRTSQGGERPGLPSTCVLAVAIVAGGCAPDGFISGILVPSKSKLEFETVRIGDRASQSFELRLTRGPPTQIAGIEAVGRWADQYRFGLSALDISRDEPVEVTVLFVPDRVGVQDGKLRVRADVIGLSESIQIRGEGVLEGIIAEQAVVRFDPVVVGSQSVRTVTIENVGSREVYLSDAPSSQVAPCTWFGPASFCTATPPGPIPPGGRTIVEINYQPRGSPRFEEATLRLRACDGPQCEVAIRLIAEAVDEGLSCVPTAMDFGQVGIGQCSDQILSCVVRGDLPVQFVSASVPEGTAFRSPSIRSVLLPSGASLEVPVQFCPRGFDSYSATLSIRTRTGNRPDETRVIALKGAGGAPRISVEPSSLDFGDVALGIVTERTLLVKNVGLQTLDIRAVEIDPDGTGVLPDGTTVLSSPDAQPLVIPPGGQVAWRLAVRPTEVGMVTTGLRLESSDPRRPTLFVPVVARVFDLPPCQYAAANQLSFGQVLRGQSALRTLVLENRGPSDCIVGPFRIDDVSGAFSLVQAPPAGRLAPGRWPVKIAFRPVTMGRYSARLYGTFSNPRRPTIDVEVEGEAGDDGLLIGPQNLDLGDRPKGCASGPQAIRLWNVGPDDVEIAGVDWLTAAPSGVTLLPTSMPVTVSPGGGISVAVRDSAQTLGRDAAGLRIQGVRDGRAFEQIIDVDRHVEAGLVRQDQFRQRPRSEVDVLLVVDHTPAMGATLFDSRRALPRWIDLARQAGLAYQFAATTTDVSFENGALLPTDGPRDHRIVHPMSLPAPQTALIRLLETRPFRSGAGSEQGLAALDRAFSSDRLFDANQGLVREQAHLSVVFMARHGDRSVFDPRRVIDRLRGLKGAWRPQDVSVHAVVGDPVRGCIGATTTAEPAPRYASLAEAFGGERYSICTPDWPGLVDGLAGPLLGERRRFQLSGQPQVASGIIVEVNQQSMAATSIDGTVNWTYDGASRTISFAPIRVPEAGDSVTVTYAPLCHGP